jgi:putative transcriptional regulator
MEYCVSRYSRAFTKTTSALKRNSNITTPILDSIHKTAEGLNKAGVMKDTTLREFDALCLPPIKEYTAPQIKSIRTKNHASQSVFAAYLNTSVSTVQKWEQGQKKPNGPSLKLLNLVANKGLQVLA